MPWCQGPGVLRSDLFFMFCLKRVLNKGFIDLDKEHCFLVVSKGVSVYSKECDVGCVLVCFWFLVETCLFLV